MFILEQRGKYTVLSMNSENRLVIMFSQGIPAAIRVGDGRSADDAVLFRSVAPDKLTGKHMDKFLADFQLNAIAVPLFDDVFFRAVVAYTQRLTKED